MLRRAASLLCFILKTADGIIITGSAITSVTLSVTGFGLIIIPIAAEVSCGSH